MTMGRIWRLALAALLAWPLLAAGAAAKPIITLHRGNLAEPGTLDPQKFFTTYESEILRDLFCGLLQIDAKAEIMPGTAKSWDVSEDGLTLTFHLRDDAKWSDGAPVTAEDFLLGFQRAFNPKTAAPYANFGYVIRNAEKVTKGELAPDQLGVRVVDPLTLEITLERPSHTLLWLLGAYPVFFPVPKHIYDQIGEDWVQPGRMVSNGAFHLYELGSAGKAKATAAWNRHIVTSISGVLNDIDLYAYSRDTGAALTQSVDPIQSAQQVVAAAGPAVAQTPKPTDTSSCARSEFRVAIDVDHISGDHDARCRVSADKSVAV